MTFEIRGGQPVGPHQRVLPDYATVTELPASRASADQCRILQSRYDFARGFCHDADVLEMACGSGIGLGYLARRARSVFGGDIDEANCRIAESTYRSSPRVRIGRMDAQRLPFSAHSFDVVVLFEALYYLDNPSDFFQEARRVLRPGGHLVISTVNPSWSGFNRSPFSKTYFNAGELRGVLERHGYDTRILAGFPESCEGFRSLAMRASKRMAVRFGLIPKTMHGKEWLKRIVYGHLEPLPREIPEQFACSEPPVEIESRYDHTNYRILYAVGKRS